LSYHYQLACHWLNTTFRVLDIACGDGFGSKEVSPSVQSVIGADIDADIIAVAKADKSMPPNVKFQIEDVTDLSFDDETFDAVLSLETIEHVDSNLFLKETSRVLRSEGLLILSTPQNSLGRIPINATHVIEYSLDEVLDLDRPYFVVMKMIGFKAGKIHFEDDPRGTNTFLVLKKKG
jgi:2-polyprenyl-3-methyl-5-hydroxy-6-metoxy-1,4-benzoquinol methylase